MSRMELYDQLRTELIDSMLLSPDAPRQTNKYHGHVTELIMQSSWADDRWVRDANQ